FALSRPATWRATDVGAWRTCLSGRYLRRSGALVCVVGRRRSYCGRSAQAVATSTLGGTSMIKRIRNILVGVGTALTGALMSLMAARRLLSSEPHIVLVERVAFAAPDGEGHVNEKHEPLLTP